MSGTTALGGLGHCLLIRPSPHAGKITNEFHQNALLLVPLWPCTLTPALILQYKLGLPQPLGTISFFCWVFLWPRPSLYETCSHSHELHFMPHCLTTTSFPTVACSPSHELHVKSHVLPTTSFFLYGVSSHITSISCLISSLSKNRA